MHFLILKPQTLSHLSMIINYVSFFFGIALGVLLVLVFSIAYGHK